MVYQTSGTISITIKFFAVVTEVLLFIIIWIRKNLRKLVSAALTQLWQKVI